MNRLIDIQHLNFGYGTKRQYAPILLDLNLIVNNGEIVILTGPSGSGKTTLLTIIGALRKANEGSVKVFDIELINTKIYTLNRIRLDIGYVFQHHNLLDSLTALQNVCMSLEHRTGFDETTRKTTAAAMLDAVGLSSKLNYFPSSLSGGQKQRVSIARALVSKPRLILADEPTASLDKSSGQEAVNVLKNIAVSNGTTVLIVTHDYRIFDIADRIIKLEDGKLIT